MMALSVQRICDYHRIANEKFVSEIHLSLSFLLSLPRAGNRDRDLYLWPWWHSHSLTPATFVTPCWETWLVDKVLKSCLFPVLSLHSSPQESITSRNPSSFPSKSLLQLHCISFCTGCWKLGSSFSVLCFSPFPPDILRQQLQKHQLDFSVRQWSAADLGSEKPVGILLSGEVGKWLPILPGGIVSEEGRMSAMGHFQGQMVS